MVNGQKAFRFRFLLAVHLGRKIHGSLAFRPEWYPDVARRIPVLKVHIVGKVLAEPDQVRTLCRALLAPHRVYIISTDFRAAVHFTGAQGPI